MKASRYNLLLNLEDGTHLIFNTLTGALAQIERNDYQIIQKILAHSNNTYSKSEKTHQLKEDLCRGGYLVADTIDELRLVMLRYRLKRYDPDPLFLVIAPTLNCNFRCSYCYEQRQTGVMSEGVQEALVDFVKRRIRRVQSFYVIWYGGEPLLYPKVILNLSSKFQQMCQAHQVHYIATMMTNGYLLSAEMIQRLAYLNLQWVQITLDGPPSIHNQRRMLANGQGTFNKILQNLKAAIDIFPGIILRINVDKQNFDSVPELIDLLNQKGLKPKLKNIYVSPVAASSAACASVIDNCLRSTEDFAKFKSLEKKIRSQIPGISDHLSPRDSNCLADKYNGFVVSPDGSLYKCLNSIGNKDEQVGTIFKGGLKLEGEFLKWLSWDPFEDPQCRECKAVPHCLGSCPYVALHGNKENPSIKNCDPETTLKEEIRFRYRHCHMNHANKNAPLRHNLSAEIQP